MEAGISIVESVKLRTYSHVLPQMHEAAAEVFAAAMAEQKEQA